MCTSILVARGVSAAFAPPRLFQKLRQSLCSLIHHARAASCSCSGTPRNSFSHTEAAQVDKVRLLRDLSSIGLQRYVASCNVRKPTGPPYNHTKIVTSDLK